MNDPRHCWVFIFSITLPATRIALVELNPITVGISRSAVAAIIASLILIITRQPWPDRDKIGKLFFAGIGIVLAFPYSQPWPWKQLMRLMVAWSSGCFL